MPTMPPPRSTAYMASKASITAGACRRTVTMLAPLPTTADARRGVVDISSSSRRLDVQGVVQAVLVVPSDQRGRERDHTLRPEHAVQLSHVVVRDLVVVDHEL